ncbi:MAG: M28 family metallopeptidase [Candidatus Hodarchaeota archaeon]
MKIEVSQEDAGYMYNLVNKIVEEVGPRMSCSPQEAKGAKIIKSELEKVCDEVIIEPFTCHPRAFLGWIKFLCILAYCSMLLYLIAQFISESVWLLFLSIISFSLTIFSFIVMWEEFFNYCEFIDFFFRKKASQNVIGKFKPKGELKKILIFSSHIDSALQFNLLKFLGWGAIPVLMGAIFIVLIWLVISFINLIFIAIGVVFLKNLFIIPNIIFLIISLPCFSIVFFFVPLGDKGNVVPGAVDNLSSCSVIVGLARYLNDHRQIIPNNIEIRLISFGCEESGLRGAYRYAAAHLDELKNYDANVVNMDGLETPDKFLVIEYEPTTRTSHSEEVIQKLLEATKSVGIDAKRFGRGRLEKTVGRLSGGSDAAAFSKAEIKAGFLNSADWKNRSSYYHQEGDTPDKIKKGTLENALKICIVYILNEQKSS